MVTDTAIAPAPAAPVAPAPAAAPAAQPAAAPAVAKVAPPSGLQLGDAQKIINAPDEDFGAMFGIDAILRGTPFEQAPAKVALESAAADEGAAAATPAVETPNAPTDVPRGDDGEPLPAYREDSKGNLHAPDGKFVAKDGTKEGEGETIPVVDETIPPAGDTKEGKPETVAAEPVKLATDFNLARHRESGSRVPD
jgi:hypothetical protein